MFNWATSKLTALSETLAPPPSTPTHRFLSALSQNNENLALQILNNPHEPLDCYASLNNRGMSSIHVAASHGCLHVVREIIGRGVRVDLTDYNGWAALHHASSSSSTNSLQLVKYLVEDCGASILLKTNEGRTAYDVASSQGVRGYLLPRQLQLETKECLDNGGKGLMPGIDLGGCQVNYSNLAPPPVIGGPPVGGSPPLMGGGVAPVQQNNNYDPSAALMQPPPVRGIGVASPRQRMQPPQQMMSPVPMASNISSTSNYSIEHLASNAPDNLQQTQQQWQPPPVASEPVMSSPPPPVTQQQFQSPPVASEVVTSPAQPMAHDQVQQPPNQPAPSTQPPQPTQQPIPQPPKSNQSTGSYALRGGNANTASVLNESATGRKIYKPDGFHSSSNDKELQAKYGHVENEFEASRKAAVPPPPMSGGAPISGGVAAPPSGGYNPYSAGSRGGGYIGGSGRARYPAYCAVSDSVSAPPSLSGGGYQYNAAVLVPTYANFSQGGFGQVQQPNQLKWSGQQQTQNSYGADQTQNSYGGGYDQQSAQQWQGDQSANAHHQSAAAPMQQQWQGELQQTQPVPAYQQSAAPVQQPWTGDAQQNQFAPAAEQNNLNPPLEVQPFSQEVKQPTATPSPPKQSQPIMAADAAASMFGTPHAITPKKSVEDVAESLPSPPIDGNTQELFGAPPTDPTPAKNEGAVHVFASPPAASQSGVAFEQFTSPSVEAVSSYNSANPVVEAMPNDAGSFFGSPLQNESKANPPTKPDVTVKSSEKLQTSATNAVPTQPANDTPASAPTKSFGGLPPPPVIGGIKPLSTASTFVASSAGSSLPPPPMARLSPSALKEDDMAAEMADISLS
jgi:hypothetical protein